MFRRCPFYFTCSSTDRLSFGNKEYHCLGSTSYEFCQKYKKLIESQPIEIIKDPIEELNKVLREVYQKVRQNIKDNIYIALLNQNGNIIYCDYSGLYDQVDFIRNFSRNNFHEISVGNFLIMKNEDNIGFYKISSTTLLAIKLSTKKFEQFESLKYLIFDFASKINLAIERIERAKKAIIEKESTKVSFYSVVCTLKSKLDKSQKLLALEFAEDLDKAVKSISNMYAWHPVIAEISNLKKQLKTYQKEDLLTAKDKKELISKLDEWEKRVTNSK